MRKLYLFFAMCLTVAISFNMQAQETVISVWDFADNSTAGTVGASYSAAANQDFTYLEGGSGAVSGTACDWTNTEPDGNYEHSYTVTTGHCNVTNGYSPYMMNNVDLTEADLVDGKLHLSVTLKSFTITNSDNGTPYDWMLIYLRDSDNNRIGGLKVEPNTNANNVKVSQILQKAGAAYGQVKQVGHLGNTNYTFTDVNMTFGTTLDFTNNTQEFWMGDPANSDHSTHFGYTNSGNMGVQTSNGTSAIALSDKTLSHLQTQFRVSQGGSFEIDQIKLSTGTYENTVAAGNTTTPTAVTTFPYCSSFDADLGDWTTSIVQGTSDWTSAASNTTTGSSSVDALSGGGSAYYYDYSYSGNGSTLISPVMDLSSISSPQVTFQLANPDWSGDQDTLAVWYRATETDAWAVLGTYTDDTTTYDEITLDLPNASATYQVAFNATSGYGYGIMLDDVCIAETPVTYYDLTLSVNTQNITVGDNGMYAGGGILNELFGNGSMAVPLTDDGTGTWSATVSVPENTAGNYIFVNSPSDGGSYDNKENLEGLECADTQNWNDRILAAVTEDTVLLHCFGSCETDGTCPDPVPTSNVTFNVNMSSYGLQDGQTVNINGEFTGWCGGCAEMTDDDGDGIYSITIALEDGSYFWKYTVDGWGAQESFSEAIDGCTAQNGANFDRQIVVDGADQTVSYCWNSCSDVGCDPLALQGIMDFTTPTGGSTGKATHLIANADIADLSIYTLTMYNNGDDASEPGPDMQLPAISATAGQHILVYRDITVLDAYMNASAEFDILIDGETDGVPNGNGDDVIELSKNGSPIEYYGILGVDGDADGGQTWLDAGFYNYTDTWAYKVDGLWTAAPENSSDNTETTCASDHPYPFTFCDTSADVIAFLGSGNWRVQAEAEGHMGVGGGGSWWAEWWNAPVWDKSYTGLYDDGWSFSAEGVMTHDTGDDGAIFGKKDAIDAAWPDNTPYDAEVDPVTGENNGEYFNYLLEDYTDTYTVDTSGDYDTVTLGSNGTIGFHTATTAQEYQILETGDGYVYFRNVGVDGNSWYNKMTTADYLSTNDSQILDMRIYPNPVDGNFVTILSPVNGIKDIQIFDLNGRVVIDTAINNNTLDVSSINSGFYMIKVTIDGQSKISKLVVR